MGKRITAIIFLILLFFGAMNATKATADQKQALALPELVHVMQNEHINIQSWSLYARKTSTSLTTPTQYYKKADQLQQRYPSFDWQPVKVNDEHHYELTGVRTLSDMNGVKETITLFAYPHKQSYKTYLIYEVQGKSWSNEKWASLSPKIMSQLEEIIHFNGKIFACASGIADDRMELVMSKRAQDILNHFSAGIVEKVKEKTFVSISAYTKKWNNSIKTNGHLMNLQVGIRQVNGVTTVTLGTPIITTEY